MNLVTGKVYPTSTTAGIGYLNKWNKDKNTINGNYQFNDQTVTGRNGSFKQTLLDDSSFSSYSTELFNSYKKRNKLSAGYEWQIDSTSTFKFKANGSIVNSTNTNEYSSYSETDDLLPINKTNRITTNSNENRDFASELSYRKRLKKAGRTISYTGIFSSNNRNGDGFLFSDNTFFDKTGNFLREENIDQRKTNSQDLQAIQNNLIYTEPLSKKWNLEIVYRNSFNRNNAVRKTLERPTPNDKYTDLVDTLSNHFLFRTIAHTGSLSFRYTGKKITASFGTAVGRTNFNLEEIRKSIARSIGFTNLLPRASIRFTPRKQKSFSLSYNGSTQNPTLQQINPIFDNIDPLNITIGNPDLKQAFRHNISFSLSDYKIIKSKSLYVDGDFSFFNNAISNSSFTDSSGRTINQTINVNGNYGGYASVGYRVEIAKSLHFSVSSSTSISHFVSRINNRSNFNDNYTASFGVGVDRWSDKWLGFGFRIQPTYNYSKSSISKTSEVKYWSMNSYPYLSMQFKKQKLYLDMGGSISLYQKTKTFATQRNIFMVNGGIRRTFTKSDAFEVKVSVNDLFNQSLTVRRNTSSNFISENTFQNIRRFWLLTLTWNFTKNGNPTQY